MTINARSRFRCSRFTSRHLGRCTLAGAALALLGTGAVSAEAFPLWLRAIDARTEAVRVRVDGHYALGSAAEYFKGRYVSLANWNGDWSPYLGEKAPKDGGVFLQLHAPGSLYDPGRLYVGVKIPRFASPVTGHDSGRLELYLGFDHSECADPEDRKIILDFTHMNGGTSIHDTPSAPLTYTASEQRGEGAAAGCLGLAALGGATAHLVDYRLDIDQDFEDGVFYFAELAISIPPSVYAAGELRFGLRYWDRDYQDAGGPRASRTMTVPNDPLCQGGQPCQVDWGRDGTYQRIDLTEPVHHQLGFSVYNVGQMLELGPGSVIPPDPDDLTDVFGGDGGEGDPEDVAEAIWSRDVVCLAEIMPMEDRQEVVEEVNKRRGAHGLPPMYAVNAANDESPNLMILSSWPLIDSPQAKRYSDLDPGAKGADDEVLGSDRGAKGVVWARIAPPPACRYGPPNADGICPENDARKAQPEWLDVFCTHTQAPCSPKLPLLTDSTCESEGDQHQNAKRQAQFQALGSFIGQQRARVGPDGKTGYSRPAILLGDLNQVGPRSRGDNWGNDDNLGTPTAGWLAGFSPAGNTDIKTSGQEAKIAAAYRDMRVKLGNWERTPLDALRADEYISGYDLSADTGGEGSWIGTEGLGQVGETRADDCTPTSVPNLHDNVRVDYVMLLPAADKVPDYGFRWAPGGPGRAQVDRHWTEDGLGDSGCVSDHAEVFAKVELVPWTAPRPGNPNRANRLVYKVAQLDDVNSSDDTVGDDGTTDWYTNVFWMETFDPLGNSVGRCDADWPTSITPAGKVSSPGWEYRGHELQPNGTAKVWLEVGDADSVSDDYYDSHSRSPCKHTELFFDHQSLTVWEQGCGMNHPHKLDEAAVISWHSKGNGDAGDDDVQILNVVSICSVSQTPGCKDPKTGPGDP